MSRLSDSPVVWIVKVCLRLAFVTLFWILVPGISASPALLADEQTANRIALTNGSIHAGDGSDPFTGHVVIRDGVIESIQTGDIPEASIRVDCTGLVIAPGFIDLHNHSDDAILNRDTRGNINYLLQGCTTVVTGNCGSGPVDVGQYLDQVDRDGAGTNIAHLLPQGSLRARVMGPQSGRATSEQMMTMLSLTEKAMKEGAFGISTGLIYIPGTFTETEELIELSRVVAAHHGFYASHIRNEGDELSASLEEAIRIGETANLPVHISHLKCSGTSNWGRMRLALEQIRSARSRGLKVTADQYPYAASSTSLDATLLPSWARDGGRPELTKRLNDPAISAKIRDELVRSLQKASRIQIAACSAFPQFVGKSLDEIAAAENAENPDVAELVLRIERNGGAAVVNFAMSEEDVRMAMPVDWVATASDGGSKVPGPTLPHPRSFGTFPRKIGLYARDLDVLTVAAAIRSATGLPAEILGLKERGTLKKDSAADIAVFHPDTFIDRATYDEPWLPPEGMRYVLVNGRFAVYAGQATGILAGRSLRKQSQKTSESGES